MVGGAFLSKEFISLPSWMGVCRILGQAWEHYPVLMSRPKASVLSLGRTLENSLQHLLTNARKESPEVKMSVSKWYLIDSLEDGNATDCQGQEC